MREVGRLEISGLATMETMANRLDRMLEAVEGAGSDKVEKK